MLFGKLSENTLHCENQAPSIVLIAPNHIMKSMYIAQLFSTNRDYVQLKGGLKWILLFIKPKFHDGC